eukprot:jgi/Mesvir1/29146/Mv18439-RA.2
MPQADLGLGMLGNNSSIAPHPVLSHTEFSPRESGEANSAEPEPAAGGHGEARAALEDVARSAAYRNLLGGLRERYRGVLRRRTQYVNLLSFVLFTAFYASILLYQRRAFLGYDIHKGLSYLLPSGGDGGTVSEFRSIARVHSWLDALVQDIWTDPICGNTVCDTPVEEPAYGRMGCQEDCGWREDLQQVTVDLSYIFDNEYDRTRASWNICRSGTCSGSAWDPAASWDACYFQNSGMAHLEGNISATAYLKAGSAWEACLVTTTLTLPVAGEISHAALSEEERLRRNSLRMGYLGVGPFDTEAPQVGSVMPPGVQNRTGAVQLTRWDYDREMSACHRSCLTLVPCIFRCTWLREVAEAQLNLSLAELFDVSAMIHLCEMQLGCADRPEMLLRSYGSVCESAYLTWALLGNDLTPPNPENLEGPPLFLAEGTHARAPWFYGTEDDVLYLANLFANNTCYGYSRPLDESYCAGMCRWTWPGDNYCDAECNVEACHYDFADCCVPYVHRDGVLDYHCAAHSGHWQPDGRRLFRYPFTVPTMDGGVIGPSSDSTGSSPSLSSDVSGSEDFRWRVVGVTNRIIGGILIKQHRTPPRPAPYGKKFRWLFNIGFSTSNWAEPFGANPRFLTKSTLYVEELVNHAHEYFTPDQLTDQDVPFAFFPLHHHGRDIFPIFIDISKSHEEAKMWVEYLREASFLDVATEDVQVEFVTYNGILKHFGHVSIDFRRQPGGVVVITSTVETFSLDMYNTPAERMRGVGEVLLVLMVLAGTLFELQQVRACAANRNIHQYLANIANLIDLASITLMYICIGLWIHFLVRYHGHLDIQLSYQPYRTDFESDGERLAKMLELANGGADMRQLLEVFEKVRDISWVVGTYSFLAALNLLFLILRILKLTDFHPRLGIVTHTLTRAMNDIGHYLLVAGVLFLSFSAMAHLSFGTILFEFSTLLDAINTCFLMLIGEVGINDKLMKMEGLQLAMGWVFFWLYIIIMYFILINFFIAFIIDSFSDHMKSGARCSSTVAQDMRDVFRDAARQCWEVLVCKAGHARNDASVAAKLDALATLTADTSDDAGTGTASRLPGTTLVHGASKEAGSGGQYAEVGVKELVQGASKNSVRPVAVTDGDGAMGSINNELFSHREGDGGAGMGDAGGGVMRTSQSNGHEGGYGHGDIDPRSSPYSADGRKSTMSRLLSWILPGGWRAHRQDGCRKGERWVVIEGCPFSEDEIATLLLGGMQAFTRLEGAEENLGGEVQGEDMIDQRLRAKAHKTLFGDELANLGGLRGMSSQQPDKPASLQASKGRGEKPHGQDGKSVCQPGLAANRSLTRGKLRGISKVDEEVDLESSQYGEGAGPVFRLAPASGTHPVRREGSLVACHNLVRDIASHAIWRFGTSGADVVDREVDQVEGTRAAMMADASSPETMAAPQPPVPENPTVQIAHMVGALQAQLVELEARWTAALSDLASLGKGQQPLRG